MVAAPSSYAGKAPSLMLKGSLFFFYAGKAHSSIADKAPCSYADKAPSPNAGKAPSLMLKGSLFFFLCRKGSFLNAERLLVLMLTRLLLLMQKRLRHSLGSFASLELHSNR